MSPILTSAVIAGLVSAMISGAVQIYAWFLNRSQERYQQLYGPLKLNLLMMQIITENSEEIAKEIQETIGNTDIRIESLSTHISPLTREWLVYRDTIKLLIEKNIGLVRHRDIALVKEFMDAHLKRKIIQEGQNSLATEERITKIIGVIKKLQDKLL